MLLVSIFINTCVVWKSFLFGVNTLADIHEIYNPVEVTQKVVEEQECRTALDIHLE